MNRFVLAAAATFVFAMPAQAATTVLLSDTFDTDGTPPFTQSGTNINFNGFSNFDVNGNVDLVQSGDFGITCSGKCVDLDGTTGPGEIVTKSSYGFAEGDIISLIFRVGGNQRGSGPDFLNAGFRSQGGTINYNNISAFFDGALVASFGNLSGSSLGVGIGPYSSNTPFTDVTLQFRAGNAGSFKAYLGTASADNVGPLIDSVSLTSAVPEPATWAMMIMGFGLIGGALRRAKPRVNVAFA